MGEGLLGTSKRRPGDRMGIETLSHYMHGLKVIIVPEGWNSPRTWRERLFTRPWRPWQKTKWLPNPARIEGDQVYKVGDIIYANQRQARIIADAATEAFEKAANEKWGNK